MKKRINKILWYGSELENGKAKVPSVSVEENGLDGLNEGELYISNNEIDPALFIRTSNSKVVRLGEANYKPFKFEYDESIDALVLSRTDGKPAHFLASGALSTRGLGEIEEGGGGTGTGVDLLNVPSDVIPSVGGSYNLGSSERAWKTIYANGGIIGNTYIDSARVIFGTYIQGKSWVINPDGSATFSSLTINGASAATQNWVNSQSFAKASDLTSINNSISSLQQSTFTGANNPEGYTLTWFTQSGGGRNVTIPAYGEVGTVATDGLAGIGQNVALVDQWLIADLMDYIAEVAAGGNVDLSNYVTLNSAQTISGKKTFTGGITVQNGITASHLYSVEYLDSSELTINAEKVTLTYDGDDANLSVGLLNGYKPLTLGNTSFSPALTSGTVIGTITIGGESKTIFAPNGGSVDLSNYVTLDSEQTIIGSKYFTDLNANSIFLQGFELKPYSLDGGTPDRLKYDGYVLLDEYNYSEYLDSAYIKKSGGTITGQLGFSGSTFPHIYGNGAYLIIGASAEGSYGLTFDYSSHAIRPRANNDTSLGISYVRWSNVYSVLGNFSGQITSSVADGTSPFVVASKTEVANLHSATATKLHTARTLWGQSFDGSGNVSGALSGVTSITGVSGTDLVLTNNGNIQLKYNNNVSAVVLNATQFKPFDAANGLLDLGATSARWKVIYGQSLDISGNATIGGETVATQVWVNSQNFVNTSDLSNYVTLNTEQTISERKTFSKGIIGGLHSIEAPNSVFVGLDSTVRVYGGLTIGTGDLKTPSITSDNVLPKSNSSGSIGSSSLKWLNGYIDNLRTVELSSSSIVTDEIASKSGPILGVNSDLETYYNIRGYSDGGDCTWEIGIDGDMTIQTINGYKPLTVGNTSFTPTYTGGMAIGTIKIGDVVKTIYAPSGGSDLSYITQDVTISVNPEDIDQASFRLYFGDGGNIFGMYTDDGRELNLDADVVYAAMVGVLHTEVLRCYEVIQMSDIRYKDIKESVHLELSDIAAAPTFRFNWNDKDNKKNYVGSSAQYWQSLVEEFVVEDKKTGKLGLDYSTAALVSAVSIAREVNTMKMWQTTTTDRIEELEDKVKKLEEENKALRELLNNNN